MKTYIRNILLAALLLISVRVSAQFTPAPAAVQAAPVLLQGATVHVGNGTVLQNTDVLLVGGKITQVATGITAPAGAQVIDVRGQHLYPGLIAMDTYLGLSEISAVQSTNDFAETGSLNPNVHALVSFNTDSHIIPTVRSNGVLLAQVVPVGGMVTGRSVVVQLDAWNYEDAAISPDEGLHIRWPNMRPGGNDPKAQTEARERLTKNLESLDKLFTDAAAYRAAKAAGQNKTIDLRLDAVAYYLEGKGKVYLHADDGTQLTAALNFAEKFKLRAVVVGGYEFQPVANRLVNLNIPVVVYHTHNLPARADDDYDYMFKLPALMRSAGITVAIGGESAWQNLNLPFYAGMAAGHGLTREQALEAITLTPARILGIEGRLGSIEVGKDATLVVSTGDVLDMRTSQLTHAFISGRQLNLADKFKTLNERFKVKYSRMK